jgi:hypothetical protein
MVNLGYRQTLKCQFSLKNNNKILTSHD